jgi:Protein of unknown function (DUF3396)
MHVEKRDDDGELLVRDSLVAAFFSKLTYPKLAKSFGDVFEQWLENTPEDAKRFAIIGPHGDEFKPFNPKQVARARAEFDLARAKTRNICAVDLGGPQRLNPDHRFSFLGVRDLSDDRTNVVEVRSPSGDAESTNVECYVENLRKMAEQIPYDSGYASPALTYGVHSQQTDFAKAARKWAFRHPGFDMPNSQGTNAGLERKLRGAYWLTFVGPWALEKLGRHAALRKALPKEIELQPVGAGVMLRAGKYPEVGDVNKGDRLPLLRAMAKVLEPVTLFDDAFLDNLFVDDSQRARWERRHLD